MHLGLNFKNLWFLAVFWRVWRSVPRCGNSLPCYSQDEFSGELKFSADFDLKSFKDNIYSPFMDKLIVSLEVRLKGILSLPYQPLIFCCRIRYLGSCAYFRGRSMARRTEGCRAFRWWSTWNSCSQSWWLRKSTLMLTLFRMFAADRWTKASNWIQEIKDQSWAETQFPKHCDCLWFSS